MNTQNRQNTQSPQATAGARHPIDAQAENDYWRSRYDKEGYYEAGRGYDDYESAYRAGYEGHDRHAGRTFDEAENDLKANWETAKGNSRLAWDQAKQAARAAWDRVERAMPGDADRDGR